MTGEHRRLSGGSTQSGGMRLTRSHSKDGHGHHGHGMSPVKKLQRCLTVTSFANFLLFAGLIYFFFNYNVKPPKEAEFNYPVSVERMPFYEPKIIEVERVDQFRSLLQTKNETQELKPMAVPLDPPENLKPPEDTEPVGGDVADGPPQGNEDIIDQEGKPDKPNMIEDEYQFDSKTLRPPVKVGETCADLKDLVHRGREKICGKGGVLAGHRRRTTKSDNHMIVDDARKLVYCTVPMAGSNRITNILITTSEMFQSNHENRTQGILYKDITMDTMHKYGLRMLNEYNFKTQEEILKTYYKFLIVRNPMSRLAAMYRDIFLKNKNSDKFPHLTKKLLNRYRPDYTDSQVLYSSKTHLKWVEVVDFILFQFNVSQTFYFADDWDTVQNLCEPCVINYDFIGQVEQMDSNFKCIQPKISPTQSNLSSEIKFSKSETLRQKFQQFSLNLFSSLGIKDKWSLYRQIYKNDCEMFGYDCLAYMHHLPWKSK